MSANNQVATPNSARNLMEIIKATPITDIPELEFVKNKYVTNYNACNPSGDGELMYHRNLIFLKQAIAGFKTKEGNPMIIDPFSVYECITTMAVYGLSAAPIDEEVYLYAKDQRMFLQRQAGSYVKRLQMTGQVASVKKVDLVYRGDEFIVEDDFIKKHVKHYQSDEIIAGYIKFNLPNNTERHFDYRRSDWESWRAHSPLQFSDNWRHTPPDMKDDKTFKAYQPKPGFLKTKIISHACQEKSWTPGRTPATVEVYSNVFIDRSDDDDIDDKPEYAKQAIVVGQLPPITPHQEIPPVPAPIVNAAPAVNSTSTAATTTAKTVPVNKDEDF